MLAQIYRVAAGRREDWHTLIGWFGENLHSWHDNFNTRLTVGRAPTIGLFLRLSADELVSKGGMSIRRAIPIGISYLSPAA